MGTINIVPITDYNCEVHFDPTVYLVQEDDVCSIIMLVRSEFGSVVYLDASAYDYGILTIKVNCAITNDRTLAIKVCQYIRQLVERYDETYL